MWGSICNERANNIYRAPKSKIESSMHYAPEPVWGAASYNLVHKFPVFLVHNSCSSWLRDMHKSKDLEDLFVYGDDIAMQTIHCLSSGFV